MWHIKPWFDTTLSSNWSHLKDSDSASIAENCTNVWEMTNGRWIGFGASTIEGGSTFLFSNFSLLIAFRLRVEGLDFFFLCKDTGSLELRRRSWSRQWRRKRMLCPGQQDSIAENRGTAKLSLASQSLAECQALGCQDKTSHLQKHWVPIFFTEYLN